jgi:hypothetical protein
MPGADGWLLEWPTLAEFHCWVRDNSWIQSSMRALWNGPNGTRCSRFASIEDAQTRVDVLATGALVA